MIKSDIKARGVGARRKWALGPQSLLTVTAAVTTVAVTTLSGPGALGGGGGGRHCDIQDLIISEKERKRGDVQWCTAERRNLLRILMEGKKFCISREARRQLPLS